MQEVLVKNADRMMTSAIPRSDGIYLTFADGASGLLPYSDVPEIGKCENLCGVELPNPYQLVLTDSGGTGHEIPWDFARAFCDSSYEPRVEAVAERGRLALGGRIRWMRLAAGMTQEELASAAGIGRVTLVRLESGEQSPRYETLVALAGALGRPVGELLGVG
jgi:DNA-binding XRE family transcriptional regulator